MRLHLIASARPNFMKIAPLWKAIEGQNWCEARFIHAGQHYDAEMSEVFLHELGLPFPHHLLKAGSGTHGEQTARILTAYERVCMAERPDWTIVVGDVNATFAATLAAKKLGIRVAHLEAGLRSFDRSMPEEINRVLTDAISDLLWTPSADADENLSREGVPAARIERVGNIMIDAYEMRREAIEADPGPAALGLATGAYAVVTLHRPSNVDEKPRFEAVLEAICSVAARTTVVFPVHPRTRKSIETWGLSERLSRAGVRLLSPLGYVAFMALVRSAGFVLTDSGGVQEETSYLGVPCLTLRDTTERPITVTEGTNKLINLEMLPLAVAEVLSAAARDRRTITLWDGLTAGRCIASLQRHAEIAPR